MKQEIHRPGALKQTNKQHKTGRHRSKSVINNELKGGFSLFLIRLIRLKLIDKA